MIRITGPVDFQQVDDSIGSIHLQHSSAKLSRQFRELSGNIKRPREIPP